MSFNFSEESNFFIRHWEKIEEFLESEKRFRKEFSKYLYSIEDILSRKEWWSNELVFKKYGDKQIYITKNDWKDNIWIGVENFSPENLIGNNIPAHCYLWVTGNNKEIILTDLRERFKGKEEFENDIIKDSNYVLKRLLKKYVEEEYEAFTSEGAREEIVNFFEKIYLIIKDYKIEISV